MTAHLGRGREASQAAGSVTTRQEATMANDEERARAWLAGMGDRCNVGEDEGSLAAAFAEVREEGRRERDVEADREWAVAWREGVGDALDCLHESGIMDKGDCIGRLERLLAPPGEPPQRERDAEVSDRALERICEALGGRATFKEALACMRDLAALRRVADAAREVAGDWGMYAHTKAALRDALAALDAAGGGE